MSDRVSLRVQDRGDDADQARTMDENRTRHTNAMNHLHRITVDPQVCGGRPTIRGLRIRVKDVLDLLAAGAERNEILTNYPYLEADDITAVLEFSALQHSHPVLRSAG